ncbi:MAG: glycerol kinase GlpK [Rhodospirillales bacterium]|nr:glycerol kinase GlpK [Rhodospirillales bacterium]
MSEGRTILAIDQGTTNSRAILFSADGAVLDVAQKELALHYPEKGWVEQDPKDIWEDTRSCCTEILSRAGDDFPAVIGITNQRETTIVWDRETGEAVYNAIVWQDRRTADLCADMRARGVEEMVRAKTGLLLDPYFSATKIAWILDNVPGARGRAEAGALAFGTVDCYVLWKLTGGHVHATDVTNASRTMLYNIVDQGWDDELLALFDIPAGMLPEVRDNIADFGMSTIEAIGAALPIGGMAGDQQAALIGQGCLKPGMMKSTYGTGCFALMHIGDAFKASHNRLLTTSAYRVDGRMSYAIEGSIFVAGAAVQWLRDGLGLIDNAGETEKLAQSVSDNNGVYFVPAFTGLGAPHWRPEARALISGLGRESAKAHVVRAALEAQAYQTLDLLGAMEDDSGFEAEVLRIDGGLAANGFVCQFLADMTGRPVEVPQVAESTAWGAAMLAGVRAGIYRDLEEAAQGWRAARRYEPAMDSAPRTALYAGWKAALGMLLQEN